MTNSCVTCWRNIIEKIERGLRQSFGKWGIFVGKRPALVLILTLILGCILSSFIVNISEDKDSEDLFIAKGTVSNDGRLAYEGTWGDLEDMKKYAIVNVEATNGDNLYALNYLNKIYDLHSTIMNCTIK
jgi:hypothetical protein